MRAILIIQKLNNLHPRSWLFPRKPLLHARSPTRNATDDIIYPTSAPNPCSHFLPILPTNQITRLDVMFKKSLTRARWSLAFPTQRAHQGSRLPWGVFIFFVAVLFCVLLTCLRRRWLSTKSQDRPDGDGESIFRWTSCEYTGFFSFTARKFIKKSASPRGDLGEECLKKYMHH